MLEEFADCSPTLESLFKIHKKLVTTIPYENLSVFYGTQPVTTNIELITQKFSNNRGGFCLELNSYYHEFLKTLGFEVVKRVCKVTYFLDKEDDHVLPTHQTLIVTIDGDRWLCDIGAAEYTPITPMKLDSDKIGLGSGGIESKILKGKCGEVDGYRFEVWNKSKSKIRGFKMFAFFEDIHYPDEYYEEMTRRLSTPATCPPRPYFTEFATKPLLDNSRLFIVGNKANGYTFYVRDSDGNQTEKRFIQGVQEFQEILWSRFSICLEI